MLRILSQRTKASMKLWSALIEGPSNAELPLYLTPQQVMAKLTKVEEALIQLQAEQKVGNAKLHLHPAYATATNLLDDLDAEYRKIVAPSALNSKVDGLLPGYANVLSPQILFAIGINEAPKFALATAQKLDDKTVCAYVGTLRKNKR